MGKEGATQTAGPRTTLHLLTQVLRGPASKHSLGNTNKSKSLEFLKARTLFLLLSDSSMKNWGSVSLPALVIHQATSQCQRNEWSQIWLPPCWGTSSVHFEFQECHSREVSIPLTSNPTQRKGSPHRAAPLNAHETQHSGVPASISFFQIQKCR